MKHLHLIYILIILTLFSCNSTTNKLDTAIIFDDSLEQLEIVESGGSNPKCLFINANVKDSDNETLFNCECEKIDKKITIKINNCLASFIHKELIIDIADSTFVSNYRYQSDYKRRFIANSINQKLVLNQYPQNFGDTITGIINFVGIAISNEEGRIDSSLSGKFTCVIKNSE